MDIWLLLLLALGIPALGVAGFVMAIQQRRVIATLQVEIGRLARRMEGLETAAAGPPLEAVPEEAAPEPEAEAEVRPEPEPEPEPEPAPQPVEVPIAAKVGLEERLASRWMVWLGAVALALSGLFLILYAVEHGWIGPTARVTLGLLLGIALAAAGEWARRRPWQSRIAGQHANHAPGALTGAGLFVAFASIYGAHALYGLIGPLTTFIGLALVAAVGFALAVLHAPIVAVVGLLAAFATPILVGSDTPSAGGLFGYLALVVAAALGVVRYRDWAWLAVSAVTGGFLWTILWLFDAYRPGDLFVVTGYLGFLAATSVWLASEETPPDAPVLWRLRRPELSPQIFAFVVCLVAGLLAAWAIAETGGAVAPVLVLVAATVAAYGYGRRNERFDGLTVVAGVMLVVSLAGWPLGDMLRRALEVYTGPGASAGGLLAEPARMFLFIATGLAALVAGLGYRLLWGATRPFVWAGVPTLTAALILALAYHRLGLVSDTSLWAAIAALAALLALAAARTLDGHRGERPMRLALGFYAVATVAGIAFALAFVLRDAWLTVALSLMLPALGWIGNKLELREMRAIALVLAGVVLVRLVFNPFVLDYDTNAFLGAHWVIYGYGVPAAAFYVAMRLFGRSGRSGPVFEGGALAFGLMAVSLELRVLAEGAIDAPRFGLFEASLQSGVWLLAGWRRASAWTADHRAFDRYAAIVLIALGGLCVLGVQVIEENPLFTRDSIGPLAFVNVLALAYLLPGMLALLIARHGPGWSRLAGAGVGLGLMLLWLSLETRHWFQGEVLSLWRGASSAEMYALSAVWLVFALALWGLGALLRQPLYRYGALGIVLLAALKVFLIDMADLDGLYRVASFLGLGLSLVSIGLLYQRFVATTGLPPPEPDTSAS
ncbi:MAG TPA: DUF2339 domain-containing protein [Aestuariivirgaceae bacterium]|nr:DUF2339 domain-containing protein [Aestuariivirgaceae bacterium]